MSDRAALVEKVRDIIAGSGNCNRWCEGSGNPHCGCRDDATAAIAFIRAEVLEEAARVADGGITAIPHGLDEWTSGYLMACTETAAAIRALKEKA